MIRSAATVLALAMALSAAGESLNHTTGTQGVLLIDKLGGHVRFLDPASLNERSNLELPKNPHDFALSADHRFAYVPIYGPGIYNRNPEPGHELYVLDLAQGKVASARLLFRQAAEADFAPAAMRLAATYDPAELSALKVLGVSPDVAEARKWYERARELGAPEAEQRLASLPRN